MMKNIATSSSSRSLAVAELYKRVAEQDAEIGRLRAEINEGGDGYLALLNQLRIVRASVEAKDGEIAKLQTLVALLRGSR